MAFIDKVLEPPGYGWAKEDGTFIKPQARRIFSEFFSRLNIFQSRKNWLAFIHWFWVLALAPFLILFFMYFFSWGLLAVAFIYSMVLMGSHGTIWFHRYSTHRAYKFGHPIWRFLTRHLVIKVLSEEVYVVSHHVHHAKSEQPGDPYNVNGGWFYCFLADVNHQRIAQNLTEKEYEKLKGFLTHTGMYLNTYEAYKKWGSLAHPRDVIRDWVFNWSFWYLTFFLIGGHALAFAIFGSAVVWAVGVRTFNYDGHGQGKDKRKPGIDFNQNDLSVNQIWPGYVAGEWHNNHHLFPRSAKNGFLPYQLDLPWLYIKLLHKLGGVTEYRDDTPVFFEKHYLPFQKQKGTPRLDEALKPSKRP